MLHFLSLGAKASPSVNEFWLRSEKRADLRFSSQLSNLNVCLYFDYVLSNTFVGCPSVLPLYKVDIAIDT